MKRPETGTERSPMDGNPYSRMIELIRKEASAPDVRPDGPSQAALGAAAARLRLGTVSRTGPLQVTVAGVPMPASVLRVSPQLELTAGDSVLMLTENDQIFYIVMKVVSAV